VASVASRLVIAWTTSLPEELAVTVKAVAADAGDLGGVREAQAGRGASDPGRAAHDAAVAVVEFLVVGLAGAAGLDRVEDDALERRLVALDGQEAVRVPAPARGRAGDVLRRGGAGMDGIDGDDRACQLHAGQQFPDLGDLGGAVWHPDLPDDCLPPIPCVLW